MSYNIYMVDNNPDILLLTTKTLWVINGAYQLTKRDNGLYGVEGHRGKNHSLLLVGSVKSYTDYNKTLNRFHKRAVLLSNETR